MSSTTIETPDGPMPAEAWLPPGETGPGIVVFHEIFGITDYLRRRCADLAELGYVVCAPNFYWRLGIDALPEAGDEALQEAIGASMRVDWPAAVRDGLAALEHVRGMLEVTGRVALLGFCFGGGLAFNVAADDAPDALVSYYGTALPRLLDRATDVTAPSLHHFGLADAFFPVDVVGGIQAAVSAAPDVRFETYEGANHAFDNPLPAFHHPEAARMAWGVTVRFLADVLGGPDRPGRPG
jgi:carboxymethylenebutenolidase